MQQNLLTPDLFEGLISLEQGDGWVKPWRLPHKQRALFPSPDDGLMVRAEMANGARLRYTISGMRRDIEAAHRALVDESDIYYYFNGLDLFDEELIERYTEDLCHPDGNGIEIMADHFNRVVMSVMNPA